MEVESGWNHQLVNQRQSHGKEKEEVAGVVHLDMTATIAAEPLVADLLTLEINVINAESLDITLMIAERVEVQAEVEEDQGKSISILVLYV